jgi:hypothetical protein
MVKIIDGMVWCNEIEKWITIEEALEEEILNGEIFIVDNV